LNSSIAATLIANNVTASDAQNASNLAISALNDETRFSAIQNSVIQLDNLKHEVINNLTNKGIQENDAIRIAQRVADQNSDLIKKQVTASDTASRTIANNALQAGITQSLSNAGVTNELATSAGKEVTAQLVAINPATSALASPTPSQIQTPDVLAGELKTLITHKLEPLVGQQQAATVADQYASAIFTSPNSLLNVTKDQVKTYQNTVSNAQDKTLAETFNNYIAPTKDLWMTAQLMTDPGQMIAHSAATGVMYSQPVAIKNTPPVLLV
jgi:hypothetical protein